MRRFFKNRADPATLRLSAAIAEERDSMSRASWLTVAAGAMWLIMAAAVAILFGRLVNGGADPALIFAMSGLFVVAGIARVFWDLRAAAVLQDAADRILARERAALVAGQDRLSPRADRIPSAAAAAILTDKLPYLIPFVLRYKPAALRAAVLPILFLVLSAWFSWVVALTLAVAGPLIPVFMALIGLKARQASEQQMEAIGSLSDLLGERLAALTDIRLLDARTRVLEEFSGRADDLRERTMAVLRVAFLSSTVLELFAAIGVAMVAVYVGFSLLGELNFGAWASPLTLGEGVFLLLLAPEFFRPLRDLAGAWHDKAAAVAVCRDLAEIEATPAPEILGAGNSVAAPSRPPLVSVRNLEIGPLRFPDLSVEPGEGIALTGPSGSGKSTLISLLGGLERPDRGEVTMDGRILDASSADEWRACVTWLPQTAHFLAGPLRDSLALGLRTTPSDAEVLAALRLASADRIIAQLPDGLETALGETGGGVSGGEARRLLLAQAALSRKPVVLADEPTADLDGETASAVIEALVSLKAQGASLIVATHDAALAGAMDRQVALHSPVAEAAQ